MVVTIIIIMFYWFMIDIMLSLATSIGNSAVVTTEFIYFLIEILDNDNGCCYNIRHYFM